MNHTKRDKATRNDKRLKQAIALSLFKDETFYKGINYALKLLFNSDKRIIYLCNDHLFEENKIISVNKACDYIFAYYEIVCVEGKIHVMAEKPLFNSNFSINILKELISADHRKTFSSTYRYWSAFDSLRNVEKYYEIIKQIEK